MNLNDKTKRALNRCVTSLAAIAAVSSIFGAKALDYANAAEAARASGGVNTVTAPLTPPPAG